MKTTEKEEKRLQRNAEQRRKYAQRTQADKDAQRQKNKERYAERKRMMLKGPISANKEASLERRRERYADKIKERRMGTKLNSAESTAKTQTLRPAAYANKGITIEEPCDGISTGDMTQEPPQNDPLHRGKAEISFYSSFYTGSTSSGTCEVIYPPNRLPQLRRDFPISRMRRVRHIALTTSCEAGDTIMETQPVYTPELTHQVALSKKRKRMDRKKVLSTAKKNSRDVSCREYYCYKLQIRPDNKSILLRAGRLAQQFVVDMYVKLETSRLDYFRQNQNEIRAEVYQGIKDSIASGETRAANVGKRIVLPASFTGGPRDMRKRYMDAISLVQKFVADDEVQIVDEIQQFQSARWISAAEAMWRIYRFNLHEMHPAVQSLHLHLEELWTIS